MHKKEDSVRQPDHPVVNPPKWLKKLAMILTSVLLLTIFGLGGYWLGARQQQSSSTSLFTKPIPSWPSTTTSIRQRSLTPTKVNNKATSNSNWKTFTFEDKRLGYSLRYPANMYLKQVGDFPVIISNFQGDVPPDQKYNKGNLLISIVDFNFKEASVGDYLDAWWVDYKRDGIPPVPPRALGTIMIGDIQAVKTVNPIATHLGGKVMNQSQNS
jgi:hypothetical protein